MLILALKEILQDQLRIFQDACFKGSEIHQLTIMYRVEHTNHDFILNSVFQNIYKLILHAPILHQYCLPYLSGYKNLLFR